MDSKINTMTVGEIRKRLIEKAGEDQTFRAQLLTSPLETVRDELGIQAPEGFTLQVHEETAHTAHLVLPPVTKLDEQALEAASGAGVWDYAKGGWG